MPRPVGQHANGSGKAQASCCPPPIRPNVCDGPGLRFACNSCPSPGRRRANSRQDVCVAQHHVILGEGPVLQERRANGEVGCRGQGGRQRSTSRGLTAAQPVPMPGWRCGQERQDHPMGHLEAARPPTCCVDPVSWLSTKVQERWGHQPSRPGALPSWSRSRSYCVCFTASCGCMGGPLASHEGGQLSASHEALQGGTFAGPVVQSSSRDQGADNSACMRSVQTLRGGTKADARQ